MNSRADEENELDLVIHDVSRSGPGVARDDEGRVVFVPGTAPGDRVRVRVVKREKRYLEAEVLRLMEPSPERIEPRCPVFGRCGGCSWQHLSYERQWRTKVSGAMHALGRVGLSGVEGWDRDEFPAADPWHYRNRVQLRGGDFGLGFYARGSHEVVPVVRCEIASERINEVLPDYREQACRRAGASKLELEVGDDGGVMPTWNAPHAARGFRQVHDAQNLLLRGWVERQLSGGALLLDLYGGSGNLSLGIADRFEQVHCVDVGAGRRSGGGRSSVPANFWFHAADVGKWVERALTRDFGAGLGACILDPPREGCGRALTAIDRLLSKLKIDRLVLVGCDADSWARDQARFCDRGWRVERLAFFDFFPQTVHFESAAVLLRV